jgi:hypothetical protein
MESGLTGKTLKFFIEAAPFGFEKCFKELKMEFGRTSLTSLLFPKRNSRRG